jgi:predicted branched-subunit amino acid permease
MGIWGMVTGVAMVQSGLSPAQAIGMTLIVFAGSAQLASLPLLAMATPLPIIWASALIVNLRFVMYSVSVKPFFERFPLRQRLWFGFGTTDVVAAAFVRRFEAPGTATPALLKQDAARAAEEPAAYFRGAAWTIWLVWQLCSIAGIVLAQSIPAAWGLEFVATIALIAMLLPMVTDRAALICAAAAALASALLVALPLNLGLLAAVMIGVAAAMLAERMMPPDARPTPSADSISNPSTTKTRRDGS